jgi:hopanoid biosynthesis associated RND transporter like protein HpnN
MVGLPQALASLADRLARRPVPVVLAFLLLAAIALAISVQHLRIDTSTTEMISPDVSLRRNLSAFQQAFPDFNDTIVAVIEGATPERVDQAASALAEVLRASAQFTAVDYPSAEAFFARNGVLYLPLGELAELTDRLAEAQPLLAALVEDPSLRGLAGFLDLALRERPGDGAAPQLDRMLDAMAQVVEAQLAGRYGELSWQRALQGAEDAAPAREVVVTQPKLDHSSMAPAAGAIAALRSEAAALGIDPDNGLRLGLTGAAVLDTEELESAGSGALFAAVLSITAVAALLVWGLRSLRLIAATLLTLAVGLILTACFATLIVGRLNLISITFAVLFVGLGVDFGIHLVLRFREALDGGEGRRPALHTAVAGVAGPLSLSALCAGFGFLAFVPTDYLGLAELGIISAGGMAIAWLVSLTLLPALLAVSRPAPGPLRRWRIGSHRSKRPGLVVGAAVLAGIASLAALPAVTFDFNPLNLKDPTTESMRVFTTLAADPATSPQVVDALAPTLGQADALAARLAALPEIEQALTLTNFVPEAQADKLELIDQMAFYLGPTLAPTDQGPPPGPQERREGFARLGAVLADAAAGAGAERLTGALATFGQAPSEAALAELEARLTGTLPELLERLRLALDAGPVTLDDLPAGLRDQWVNAQDQARILARPAAPIDDNAELEALADAVLAAAPTATGTPIVVLEGGREVVGAFLEASVLALAVITLLLAIVLRDVRDLLFVLAPLGLAVLLTAASAVLLDLRLNFANVIVLPLLLGLGVSGALHVVMRWREEGRLADLAGTSTPRAVLFSALTTVASFGSLAVSDHPGLASMGLLLTIAIFWSLVCNLLVLPSMLALARPRNRRAS